MRATNDQGRIDYLRRAELARSDAKTASSEAIRDGFLKVAAEWERLAALTPERPTPESST